MTPVVLLFALLVGVAAQPYNTPTQCTVITRFDPGNYDTPPSGQRVTSVSIDISVGSGTYWINACYTQQFLAQYHLNPATMYPLLFAPSGGQSPPLSTALGTETQFQAQQTLTPSMFGTSNGIEAIVPNPPEYTADNPPYYCGYVNNTDAGYGAACMQYSAQNPWVNMTYDMRADFSGAWFTADLDDYYDNSQYQYYYDDYSDYYDNSQYQYYYDDYSDHDNKHQYYYDDYQYQYYDFDHDDSLNHDNVLGLGVSDAHLCSLCLYFCRSFDHHQYDVLDRLCDPVFKSDLSVCVCVSVAAPTTTTSTAPPTPAILSTAYYDGCYQDTGSPHILPFSVMRLGGYIASTCQTVAIAANAKYFGLEAGGVCYYGGTLASQTASSACTAHCPASSSQRCGGTNAIDLYQSVPITPPEGFRISVYGAGSGAFLNYYIPTDPYRVITAYSLNTCRDPSMVTQTDIIQAIAVFGGVNLAPVVIETITQGNATIGTPLKPMGYGDVSGNAIVSNSVCPTASCDTGLTTNRTLGQALLFSQFNSTQATALPLVWVISVPDGVGDINTYTLTINSGVCSTPDFFALRANQVLSSNTYGPCNGQNYSAIDIGNWVLSAPVGECASVSQAGDFCTQLVVPDVVPGSSPPCYTTALPFTLIETIVYYTLGVQPAVIAEKWQNQAGAVLLSGEPSAVVSSAPARRSGINPSAVPFTIGQLYYLTWDTSVYADSGTGQLIQGGKYWKLAVLVIAGSSNQVPAGAEAPPMSGKYYWISSAQAIAAGGFTGGYPMYPLPGGDFIEGLSNGYASSFRAYVQVINQTTTASGLDVMNVIVYYPASNQIVTWIAPDQAQVSASYGPMEFNAQPANPYAPVSASQITTMFWLAGNFSSTTWGWTPYQSNSSAVDPRDYAVAAGWYASQGYAHPDTVLSYFTNHVIPLTAGSDPNGIFEFRHLNSAPNGALGTISFLALAQTGPNANTAVATGAPGSTLNICRPLPSALEYLYVSLILNTPSTVPYIGYTVSVTQGGVAIGGVATVMFSTPLVGATAEYFYEFQSIRVQDGFNQSGLAPPANVTWTLLGPAGLLFPYNVLVFAGACSTPQAFYAELQGVSLSTSTPSFIGYTSGSNIQFDIYTQPTQTALTVVISAFMIPVLQSASPIIQTAYDGSISANIGPGTGLEVVGPAISFPRGLSAAAAYTQTWTLGTGVSSLGISFVLNFIPVNVSGMPNSQRPIAASLSNGVLYGFGSVILNTPSLGYFSAFTPLGYGDGRLYANLYANYTSQAWLFQTSGALYTTVVGGTTYYLINATVQHVLSSQVITWSADGTSGSMAPVLTGSPISQISTFSTTNTASGLWQMTPAVSAFVPGTGAAISSSATDAYSLVYPSTPTVFQFWQYTPNAPVVPGGQTGRPLFFQAILWNQPNTANGQTKTTPLLAVTAGQTSYTLNLCSLSAPAQGTVQLQAQFPTALLPITIHEAVQQTGNPSATATSSLSVTPLYSSGSSSTIGGGFESTSLIHWICGTNDLQVSWTIVESVSGGGFSTETFQINIRIGPCQAPLYFAARGTDNTGASFPDFISHPSTGLVSPFSICQPQAQAQGSTVIPVTINNIVDTSTGRTSNPFNPSLAFDSLTLEIVAFFQPGTTHWPTSISESVAAISSPGVVVAGADTIGTPGIFDIEMIGKTFTYSQFGLSLGNQTASVQFTWDATADLGFVYQINVFGIGAAVSGSLYTTTPAAPYSLVSGGLYVLSNLCLQQSSPPSAFAPLLQGVYPENSPLNSFALDYTSPLMVWTITLWNTTVNSDGSVVYNVTLANSATGLFWVWIPANATLIPPQFSSYVGSSILYSVSLSPTPSWTLLKAASLSATIFDFAPITAVNYTTAYTAGQALYVLKSSSLSTCNQWSLLEYPTASYPTTTTTTTSHTTTSHTSTKSTTTTTTFPLPTVSGSVNHVVLISNTAVTPSSLTIALGDTVTWQLASGASTSGIQSTIAQNTCTFQSNNPLINGATLSAGTSYTQIFVVQGAFPYASPSNCQTFTAARGLITVQGPTARPGVVTAAPATTTAAPPPTTTQAPSSSAFGTTQIIAVAVATGVVAVATIALLVFLINRGVVAGGKPPPLPKFDDIRKVGAEAGSLLTSSGDADYPF